jgi:type VI secretion system protein ImpF
MASRINPTLFDKLVGGLALDGLITDQDGDGEANRESMRHYSVPRLERFNEEALRNTVRRELAWLLNTTNLDAVVDLEPYPQVQTSVLNYGVPDLAGKTLDRRVVLQRARDIRTAIRTFEPRIDEASLVVEPSEDRERENAITYIIHADVRSAVRALPVKFRTDIEADTSAVTVRD